MEPSRLTVCPVYGSATEATSEPWPSSRTVLSTAALLSLSVIFSPAGALKTTRAVAPSALIPGKRCSSRSKAFWASVPGIEKEELPAGGAEAAPTPARVSSATHIRATKCRRRKASRPIRYRNVATEAYSRSGRGVHQGRGDQPDDVSGDVR